jgi:organic hydroperoxide reductase OsmC/OhrA
MAHKVHSYDVTLSWTGNRGAGTADYRAYGRDHAIGAAGKSPIAGSADPAFRGDATRWNPEELLVASVAACHQLWYLHLCSSAGITIHAYEDRALGMMEEDSSGSGRFISVTLRPRITVGAQDDVALAVQLHHAAHEKCFIANSVNFPIHCEPEILRKPQGPATM